MNTNYTLQYLPMRVLIEGRGGVGSDGCKPENRDILSDFSESHCVRARLAPAKVPVSVGASLAFSTKFFVHWAILRITLFIVK